MHVNFEDGDTDRSLTTEQLEAFRENFRLLDSDRDGFLTLTEVGILFRGFGQNPTDEELNEILSTLPPTGLDFDGFVTFFKKQYRPPISEDVLVQAFQVFDLTDRGVLSAEKFKEVMTTLGEPLPEAEVDAIIKEANVDGKGEFNYAGFAHHLTMGPRGIPSSS